MRHALLYLQVTALTVAVPVRRFRPGPSRPSGPAGLHRRRGRSDLSPGDVQGDCRQRLVPGESLAGAPGVMKLYDFPYCENALFLGVKVLTALTGDPFLAGNLFHLATYLMAAWAALFVLRRFGVGGQVAAAASLLFAFLPYHFWHGPAHPHLSNYAAVPLVAMVALWLCSGSRCSSAATTRGRSGGPGRGALGTRRLAACGLAALSGPYYALFGSLLLLAGGLIGLLRRPGKDRILDGAAAAGLLAGLFAVELVPFAAYQLREGVNPVATQRSVQSYYKYSLRVVNLLKPVPGHRLPGCSPLPGRNQIAVLRGKRGREPDRRWAWSGLAACSSR